MKEQKADGCVVPCSNADSRDWHAWINLMPPGPNQLHVIGEVQVPNPGVEACILTYQAKLKSEGVTGMAYLEMWCQLDGLGEYFSQGLDKPLSGSNDWSIYQIPFLLKAGERPDLLRLNLVVEGSGKIFIKDIKVQCAPLP